MAFLKRLGFYLIGFSIGLIFLFFFLKKKSDESGTSFCYLPNCRVLKDIRSKKLRNTEFTKQLFDSQVLDSTKLKNLLLEGEIDFKKSNTQGESCKQYYIDGVLEDVPVYVLIENCKSHATILEFEYINQESR